MKKIELGQFFTRKDWWLEDKFQIINFIKSLNKEILIDPFAGNGDIIKTCQKIINFKKFIQYDIDDKFEDCLKNDSLISIPYIKQGFFVTNPPYLAKNSAKRKKIYSNVKKYFENSDLSDLYQIALEKMILTDMPGVAIVPESFLNSKLLKKYHKRIDIITIIIPNPFEDTEIPVSVVCFNGNTNNTLIYINNLLVSDWNALQEKKMLPKYNINITFNEKSGQIGLRAVDLQKKQIEFMPANKLNYNLNYIKNSSRAVTIIRIDLKTSLNNIETIEKICIEANKTLEKFREETSNLLFTPFKGNNNDGIRRRRIDYKTARAILERVIGEIEWKLIAKK